MNKSTKTAKICIGVSCLILTTVLLTGCPGKQQPATKESRAALQAKEQAIASANKLAYWVDPELKIKLPDGLYWYTDRQLPDFVLNKKSTGEYNYVSRPLFIIENGIIINPYSRIKQLGEKDFVTKYINNKKYNVYLGPEKYGTMQIKNYQADGAPYSTSFPDVNLSKVYMGKPLLEGPSYYGRGGVDLKVMYNSVISPVLMPVTYKSSNPLIVNNISTADQQLVYDAVNKQLVPSDSRVLDYIRWAKYEHKPEVRKLGLNIDRLDKVAIQQNIIRFIGLYDFSQDSNRVLFICDESGKANRITGTEKKEYPDECGLTNISLNGLIDVDQDNNMEIIVVRRVVVVGAEGADIGDYYLEIWKQNNNNWKQVFYGISGQFGNNQNIN